MSSASRRQLAAASVQSHPEHGVVQAAAAVVARAPRCESLLARRSGPLLTPQQTCFAVPVVCQSVVQVGHVGRVMAVMMDFLLSSRQCSVQARPLRKGAGVIQMPFFLILL